MSVKNEDEHCGLNNFFFRAYSMILLIFGAPCAFAIAGKLYCIGEPRMGFAVFLAGFFALVLFFYLLLSGRWYE